jgi:RNA polymerase sigma factor (sigma-70 family)
VHPKEAIIFLERSDLIKRCQTGDKCAFEELYHLSCHQALKTAYLISGRRGMTEDIVQEAFIQCYKEIRRLKEPDAFNAWFYKILIHCGWRLLAKNKALSSGSFEIDDTIIDPNFCLDDLVVTREVYEKVQRAMGKLTLPLRAVVILYYYNNMTIREIAKVLGCVQGTVKSRLYNARKLLEKELRPYINNEEQNCTAKPTIVPAPVKVERHDDAGFFV